MSFTIHNADCFDVLKGMPDESVDLVITSPPYGELRTYGGNVPAFTLQKCSCIIWELYRIMKPCDVIEIDYSELATAKPEPEPEPEPTPDRRDILEAKKEKYLRILIAELHRMKETLQHPFTVGAAICNTSNVCQAACDLGEAMYELDKLEKENPND